MIKIITNKKYRKMVQEIKSQQARNKELVEILDKLQAAHENLHRVYNDLHLLHQQSLDKMQNLIDKLKKTEHKLHEAEKKNESKKA